MWLEKIIYAPLFLIFLSCSDTRIEEVETETGDKGGQGVPITFRSGQNTDVSLYIFRKEADRFVYRSEINKGWSAEGKLTTQLEKGDYQFLFVKSDGEGTQLSPTPLQSHTILEEVYFNALPDPAHEGGILPVNELFLPEPDAAMRIYSIQEEETVSCTLKRVVSRLLVSIKRGQVENGVYTPAPYPSGENIFQTIGKIEVTLSGAATAANVFGTKGAATLFTSFTETDKDSLTQEGFAAFTGPFFFPPSESEEVEIAVSIYPADETKEEVIRKVVNGQVKKNEQLCVVLWLEPETQTEPDPDPDPEPEPNPDPEPDPDPDPDPEPEPEPNRSILLTVDTQPISQETEGDKGVWE